MFEDHKYVYVTFVTIDITKKVICKYSRHGRKFSLSVPKKISKCPSISQDCYTLNQTLLNPNGFNYCYRFSASIKSTLLYSYQRKVSHCFKLWDFYSGTKRKPTLTGVYIDQQPRNFGSIGTYFTYLFSNLNLAFCSPCNLYLQEI